MDEDLQKTIDEVMRLNEIDPDGKLVNDDDQFSDSEVKVDATETDTNDSINLESVPTESQKTEIPLSDLQDSENACVQDVIQNQTANEENPSSDTLIDVSDCVGQLSTQDKNDIAQAVADGINSVFDYLNIETPSGVLQILSSMTFGDLVICFLLLLILMVMVVKWFWEVLR